MIALQIGLIMSDLLLRYIFAYFDNIIFFALFEYEPVMDSD